MSDTLATVLKSEPDWNALPSNVPPAVRTLIQGCLRKDRKERIGDISTALFLLGQPQEQAVLVSRPLPSPVWRRAMLVVAAVLILATIAAVVVWRLQAVASSPGDSIRDHAAGGTAVERWVDGPSPCRRTAHAWRTRPKAACISGPCRSSRPGRSPEQTRRSNPVFSPDGQSLAFWAGSTLKRIAVSGGTAVTIFQTSVAPSGISWGNEGILFSQSGTTIMRVSPNGGKPEVLLDLSNSEDGVFGPQLLPDGGTLLFTIGKRTNAAIDRWDEAQIVVQSLKTGVRKDTHQGWKRCAVRPDRPHCVHVGRNAVRGAVRPSEARSDRRRCARRRRRTT